MSYSERFVRPAEEKPVCYGEVNKFSTDDPECRVCVFKGSCRMSVERKIAAAEAGNRHVLGGNVVRPGYTPTSTPTTNPVVSAPAPASQRIAATPEDAFFAALTHNGSLSALESISREVTFAIQSIPRRAYPVPFWLKKKE